MSKNNEFKTMTIQCKDEVEQLVSVLTNNGYEVQVTPVYETVDDYKKTGRRPYGGWNPRVVSCVVNIVGEVPKPEYEE